MRVKAGCLDYSLVDLYHVYLSIFFCFDRFPKQLFVAFQIIVKIFIEKPKEVHGKIANVLIMIWFHFFTELSNQPRKYPLHVFFLAPLRRRKRITLKFD